MNPEPLTPATLARIRRESFTKAAYLIADDLCWSLERLRRVAAQHAIELTNANPTIDEMPDQVRRQATPKVRSIPFELRQVIEALPTRLARVLDILARADFRTPMSSNDIIDQLGVAMDNGTITQIIMELRRRLVDSGWQIEGIRRKNGGYRLVREL
jgi:hypothetical protein